MLADPASSLNLLIPVPDKLDKFIPSSDAGRLALSIPCLLSEVTNAVLTTDVEFLSELVIEFTVSLNHPTASDATLFILLVTLVREDNPSLI